MNKGKRIAAVLLLLAMMIGLAGCAKWESGIHDLHGSIIGNEYNIDIFDNTGIRTLRSHGKKIDIDNNIVEEKTYSSDSDVIRVTGYLVKRSEMEKLDAGNAVLQDTTALGLGASKNGKILERKVR